MKSRTVVFALAVLCAPVWAQSVDDDAAKAEAWFTHAIELHPELADDHDALVRSMGANSADYRNMALIEEMRGNTAVAIRYLGAATQLAPSDADAAFYYAMSLRNADPLEYRLLAEGLAIRFPTSERAAQALYWLAMDTPLIDERIDLLERHTAPWGRSDSSHRLLEVLTNAYLDTNLDNASGGFELEPAMYVIQLKGVRDSLRRGTPDGAREALRHLEDIQKRGLPPRLSHTPFYLMTAAAKGERAGYESLVKAMAAEPSDILREALNHYGDKLGKTRAQVQADVRTLLLAQAKPFDDAKVPLADYRGKVVLVNYWYPSCSACRGEDPFLQQTLRKIGSRRMEVLSVNVRPAEERYVFPYIHGNGYYFTPLAGDGAPHDAPSSVLIDQDGRAVYRCGAVRGAADQRELELQIETLLSAGLRSN
jgi:thiol-disulfide isomerase/thioredoxin